MWIGLLTHADAPEQLFSWWYRLLFGILEAPALHSVTAHHYYFQQDDQAVFPKKITKMQVFLIPFID